MSTDFLELKSVVILSEAMTSEANNGAVEGPYVPLVPVVVKTFLCQLNSKLETRS